MSPIIGSSCSKFQVIFDSHTSQEMMYLFVIIFTFKLSYLLEIIDARLSGASALWEYIKSKTCTTKLNLRRWNLSIYCRTFPVWSYNGNPQKTSGGIKISCAIWERVSLARARLSGHMKLHCVNVAQMPQLEWASWCIEVTTTHLLMKIVEA